MENGKFQMAHNHWFLTDESWLRLSFRAQAEQYMRQNEMRMLTILTICTGIYIIMHREMDAASTHATKGRNITVMVHNHCTEAIFKLHRHHCHLHSQQSIKYRLPLSLSFSSSTNAVHVDFLLLPQWNSIRDTIYYHTPDTEWSS